MKKLACIVCVIFSLSCVSIMIANDTPTLGDKLRHRLDRFEQEFTEAFKGERYTLEEIRERREERKKKRCERIRELDDYDPELDGCDEDEEWED